MLSGLIVKDTKLHSIDSIEFLKVLLQRAITALYHAQFEKTSFCCNGNVVADIFPRGGNEEPCLICTEQTRRRNMQMAAVGARTTEEACASKIIK